MAKYSVRELAELLDPPISRQTLNEHVTKGMLFRGKDRKIDSNHPVNAAWLASRKLKLPPGKPFDLDSPDMTDSLGSFDAEEMLEQVATVDFSKLAKIQVDKIHKLETLLKIRVERQHKRRELIERTLVQSVFSKLYTIDVNELRTIGAKLAPAISGILGCDDPEIVLAVEKTIDSEIIKSLVHIKRLLDEFLTSQGAEAVPEL